MKRIGSVVLCCVILACDASQQPTVRASSGSIPQWMREQPQPKTIETSAAVKQLLKDDPDLKKQLSPEEVKAALTAAQAQPPVEQQNSLAGKPSGEWGELESNQKAKDEAYRQRLERGVYIAPGDNSYHNSGCGALYGQFIGPGGIMERRFIGSAITLATAKDHGMTPHAACGAPSHDFTYQ